MNPHRTLTSLGRFGGFCTRHSLALLVTVVVPCLLWTITYFGLLLWALFTDGGIGGPLAYPAGLLFFLAVAAISGLVLLMPATALAEWFAKRFALPILVQIPVSVGALAVLCLLVVAGAVASGVPASFRGFSVGFVVLFTGHLLPLGLYWWVAQSGPLLRTLFTTLLRKLRSKQVGADPIIGASVCAPDQTGERTTKTVRLTCFER